MLSIRGPGAVLCDGVSRREVVRGGMVHGASDRLGAQPKDGLVRPEDITATIFRCLGFDPHAEIHDAQRRALPITRGRVLEEILA